MSDEEYSRRNETLLSRDRDEHEMDRNRKRFVPNN